MLETIVKSKLPIPPSADDSAPKQLDADEHNALRYVAGYVLYRIKKKYKDGNPALLAWLKEQTDDSVSATSYYQFTKLWVEKVNRGGLYLINDSVYEVFLAMELVLRQYLKCCAAEHGLNKDHVLAAMFEDNEIQFHWSLVCFDLEAEISEIVLKEIIQLWLTIRGFSYVSALVEEYKCLRGEVLRRKKAHRKSLKQKTSRSDTL